MSLITKVKEFPAHPPDEASHPRSGNADYMAMLCHEIGTPLNVILGLSYLLITIECSPQKKKEYAVMLRNSSDMIMELLKNMLYSSRMASGMVEIENIEFDLNTTIQEAAHIIATKVSEKGLNLHVSIANDVPSHCMGDPMRIRQILLNLLSNAVKFTEKGHVAVYVNTRTSAKGIDQLHITVADTGIGISETCLKKIFGKYVQADSSTSRKYGGTGLGLSISQDLAHLMQGTITVKSQPGIGSRFMLALPLQKAPVISVI